MYELYCKYVDLILEGRQKGINDKDGEEQSAIDKVGAYRIVFQMAYDCVPEELYDQNLLDQAKATMSEMQFKREFGAQFTDESDGYFRLSKMEACTIPDGEYPCCEIYGNVDDEYIVAFDPSWSGNSSSDNFAIQIFKIMDKDTGKFALIHSYAIAGQPLVNHIKYMQYVLTHFNVVGMVGDYNGGVQFVDACNESEIFKKNDLNIGVIDLDLAKTENYKEELLELKQVYDKRKRKFCLLRKPTGDWIRQANELLQASIDHHKVYFGAKSVDAHFNSQIKKSIPIQNLKWENKPLKQAAEAAKIDFLDYQKSNIERTKVEAANIEVKSSPTGSQTFDLPNNMKKQTGVNRARKDSYSALVLGNWYMKVHLDMLSVKADAKVVGTFAPFVV